MIKKMIIVDENGEREEYDVFLAFGATGIFPAYRKGDKLAYMAGEDFRVRSRGQINATPDIIAAMIGSISNVISGMLDQLPPDVAKGILAEASETAGLKGEGINRVTIVDSHSRDN